LRAELAELLHRVDRYVAGPRDDARLALDRVPSYLQHLLDKVHDPIAGRLPAHQRAAPARALTGQDARFVAVRDPLVLTEQVADLALPHADVAGRYVGELAEVPVELVHKALAK